MRDSIDLVRLNAYQLTYDSRKYVVIANDIKEARQCFYAMEGWQEVINQVRRIPTVQNHTLIRLSIDWGEIPISVEGSLSTLVYILRPMIPYLMETLSSNTAEESAPVSVYQHLQEDPFASG